MNTATQIGKRVFLRPPTARDASEWCALRTASRPFLEPWEPRTPRAYDAFGLDGFRSTLERTRSPNQDISLVCRMRDGAILGGINLSQIVHGSFHSGYLGYWIGSEHAKQGYMSDALALCLRRIFKTLRLHRVEANIQPNNTPSIALVRSAGFSKEGYSPRYLKIAGRWADHERWALLREDWRARRV